MYFIYDTKTKVNRGFADTKEEAELLLKELSHKWYYRYLVIRQKGNVMKDYYKCPCCENHVHVNELEEYVVEGKVLCSPCLDKELPMYNIDES